MITIEWILKWYRLYDVEYNEKTNTLYVNKPMLVKDFVKLRKDISLLDRKLDNFVVGRWNIV